MSSIRVLHVLGTMCAYHAGPACAAINLAQSCRPLGVQSEFFTTDMRGCPVDAGDFPVHCFPAHMGRFAYSGGLRKLLRHKLHEAQVCHIHGVWQHPTLAAAWEAQRAGVPYIVSLHGMLAPQSFRGRSGLRNRIWHRLVQTAVLERAATVHFVSEPENRMALGVRAQRMEVIGNSIASRAPRPRTQLLPHLLSLSRLHAGKNVECLIRALPLLPEPLQGRVVLKIAGSGTPAYVARLHQLAVACDPSGQGVEFAGEVSGDAKASLLEWAALLCLASHSEGQPMAVIEALAAGVPAVISSSSNLPEVAQYGAGAVVAHNTPEAFAQAIAALLLDADRYQAASRAALRLIDEQFLASVVGQRWADLYTSLAQGTARSQTMAMEAGR